MLIVAKLVVRNLRSRGVHFLSGACSNAYGCYHKQRECLAKQLSLNNRKARCQMLHSPRTAIEGWRQVLDARQFGATYVCGYVSTHARYRDLVRDRTCRQLAWRPEKPLAGPCADLQKMSCDWHYALDVRQPRPRRVAGCASVASCNRRANNIYKPPCCALWQSHSHFDPCPAACGGHAAFIGVPLLHLLFKTS